MCRMVLFAGVAALVAGCAARDQRVLFEGEYFQTKVSHESRDNRQAFTVEVPGYERNPEAARASARFGATRYCIESYGTSDITWQAGPKDDLETLPVTRGRLVFRGSCQF